MPLDSEFLLNVKERVTAKLKNLGAFIDEELPDYIMVMVANRKTESSMAKDLQLFLGEHTQEFTKWLHATLEDLKHSDRVKVQAKDKELNRGHLRPKSTKRKSFKAHDLEGSVSYSAPKAITQSRSRSRSPLTIKAAMRQREPHTDGVQIHADEDEFVNEDISSSAFIKEERKVVSTASLIANVGNLDDAKIDSTQESTTVRSIVKVKESQVKHRPRVNRNYTETLQPVGRLLQQAVCDAKANIRPPESTRRLMSPKRVTSDRPIACADVSSSGTPSESTKFYITLSGAQQERKTAAAAADSSMGPHLSSEDRSTTTRPVTNVKSRLGDRRIWPYNPRQKLSAKYRLGPVVQYEVPVNRMTLADDDLAFDQDDVVEIDTEDMDDLELLQKEEEIAEPIRHSVVPFQSEKVRLVDRFNQKQLVVTLNEVDEDEDVVPVASEKLVHKTKGQLRPSSKGDASPVAAEDSMNIPSSLDRCRYWPNCRNGDKCQYIHPSEPCSTFPRCRLGNKCVYIHPPCRYNGSCTREDCAFSHSTARRVPTQPLMPSVSPSQVVCRFQAHCTNMYCPFYHPPVPVVPRVLAVRPFPAPSNPVSVSPIPCRYGSSCSNRSTCPFIHVDVPRPQQLKWVAPHKQSTASNKQAASTAQATSNTSKKVAMLRKGVS